MRAAESVQTRSHLQNNFWNHYIPVLMWNTRAEKQVHQCARLTLPVLWSNQTSAWFLDSTLQSNVALFWAGRHRATDLPILTGSSRYTCRSWNGCELGRQANTASAEGIDLGLSVLLQPDTRETFSWSRVTDFCCNPQRIIYNICEPCRRARKSSKPVGTNCGALFQPRLHNFGKKKKEKGKSSA